MVSFDDVWLRYDHPRRPDAAAAPEILRDITFTIPDGGFRWLTGPSGAGKTSLLKLIYLAQHPTRGRIDILGTHAARISRRDAALLRRRIGVVHQDFRLLRHLSAFDNVALPMRLARRSEKHIAADVKEILDWVGLAGKFSARPEELSGGEQQRIAIARALRNNPALILADEPTGNLDQATGHGIVDLLLRLHEERQNCVIIVTHDNAIAALGQQRYHLQDGQLDSRAG